MLGLHGGWLEGNVDKNFTQEEKRTRIALQHQGVLSPPAKAAAHRQLGFQHRRRIGEHPKAQSACLRLQFVGQLLQALAHHLVVVPPSGIHRHHCLRGLLQALHFVI